MSENGKNTVEVSVKSLLEAGAHYGHQSQRWNPKMLPFIYTERNRIHIINLDASMQAWTRARKYIVDTVARGGNIMMVGTKPQARATIEQNARRAGAHFITSRWLGGALTNYETIRRSIDRMRKLEDFLAKSELADTDIKISKKEKLMISRELEKLAANLGGIRDMRKLPDLIFVVDIVKEAIAINEARRLRIPVIAIVDTNANPEIIDFPIPSNDDATRTIELFSTAVADAVLEGRQAFETRVQGAEQLKQENRAAAAAAQAAAQAASAS